LYQSQEKENLAMFAQVSGSLWASRKLRKFSTPLLDNANQIRGTQTNIQDALGHRITLIAQQMTKSGAMRNKATGIHIYL
jgi:hypothetical protein